MAALRSIAGQKNIAGNIGIERPDERFEVGAIFRLVMLAGF
jgi:hypothetical protein